ncbi:MAG TPA: hypothetical protein VFZ49_10775 [Pyrinomonadaceae bacterium]
MGFGEVDDHRFSRRLADLAETADDEGDDLHGKAAGGDHGQRKEREAEERCDDERFSTDSVGSVAAER